MKKSQFVILLVVIVLCAGGIFGYVKYRLDGQTSNGNKQEETNVINQTENVNDKTVLTTKELEQKMSEYANQHLNSVEKKFGLTKTYIISSYEAIDRSVYVSYMMDGKALANEYFAGVVNYNELQVSQNYKSLVDNLNESNTLKVYDVKSESDESYLVILSGISIYIYKSNGYEIATLEGGYSGSFYLISDNTHPLDKFDNHVSKDNIRVGENYILTIGNETGNDIVVKKYTIDSQGVLKETVLKNYSWDEVTCAMCK